MILKTLSAGSITSTGTLSCESQIVGAILITTDNTNQGTVVLRRDDASGKVLLDIDTVTSMWISGPISMEKTGTLYYSISGTGCSAQIYEWVT